jgi:hypothetical protein
VLVAEVAHCAARRSPKSHDMPLMSRASDTNCDFGETEVAERGTSCELGGAAGRSPVSSNTPHVGRPDRTTRRVLVAEVAQRAAQVQ